ncbi:MAG: thiamine pyrophosphate-binding protein [Planctomycetes bacterium]|nr:thiamine pyrophosphate-binding protein [Planctomycetota bacterium]
MKLADYLFHLIRRQGVEHVFGIPGDFALPLYAALERSGLEPILATHEPGAGFMADAYARMRGLGVLALTYGAGGLNTVNPVAAAYAEKSPILVLSGAPEARLRASGFMIHHIVKGFDSQLRVFQEVTGAAAALTNRSTAVQEIHRVLAEVLIRKRPGYLEIPRDMVNLEIGRPGPFRPRRVRPPQPALQEAFREVLARIQQARRPVIYAGVEIERFGLRADVVTLAEKMNVPVATTLMGKAVFPEKHRNFIGTYMGRLGPLAAIQAVEDSDCVLSLGTLTTDVNTGIFTAHLDPRKVIHANSEEVCISFHHFPGVTLTDLVRFLRDCRNLRRRRFSPPRPPAARRRGRGDALRMDDLLAELDPYGDQHHTLIADVGDCLFGSVSLKTEVFLASGFYATMGFAVPAAVGAQLAEPRRRPIVLVGDGAFRMTGLELATARDHGLNPIVILANNGNFASLQCMGPPGGFYDLKAWDYVALARAIGGDGIQVHTRREFVQALRLADSAPGCFLIDAVIAPNEVSTPLRQLSAAVRHILAQNR